MTDIAGLVRGANAGEGLGNAFLSHIKAVDAILHVIRVFDDDEVVHVEDSVDPVRDLGIIDEELRLKDLAWLQGHVAQLDKQVRVAADKTKNRTFEIAQKILAYVEAGKAVRHGNWNGNEVEVLNELLLLTAKPVIVLCNLSQKDMIRKKNKWLPKIKKWVDENGGDPMVPVSVELEHTLAGMDQDAAAAFCAENSCASQLGKLVKMGYNHLNLIHFFTCGADEVRAWSVRRGSKAPQAAGQIHTDFERGFIMAETMRYEDLHELETETAVKAAGKYAMNGKGHVVEDGEVIFFKFNVTTKAKK